MQKRKAKRLLGLGAGLIFKGTGFYETDYKKSRVERKQKAPPNRNLQVQEVQISLLPAKRPKKNPSPRKRKPKLLNFI